MLRMNKLGINTVEELEKYITQYINGSFSILDMQVIKDHVEKLEPGQVYFEIGVAEGKSLSTAYFCSQEGVYTIGVDYFDPPNTKRAEWMNKLTYKQQYAYIQADADQIGKIWNTPIDVLFIDGAHDYQSVKDNTLLWMPHVKQGGVVLFHDYDYQNSNVPDWVNERFKKEEIEVFHDKIAKVIV